MINGLAFKDLGSKLGGLFGSAGGLGQPKEPVARQVVRKSDHPRLTDWLPYTGYHTTEQLCVLEVRDVKGRERCEALGWAIELTPPCGLSEDVVNTLTSIVQGMPPSTCMQLQLFAGNNIEDFNRRYIDARKTPESRELARRRAAHYTKATHTALFASEPFLVRDFRLFMSGTMPCKDPTNRTVVEAALRWRDQVVAVSKSISLFQRVWTADDLVQFCDQVLNPQKMFTKEKRPFLNYDPSRLVRSQMIDPGTKLNPSDDGQQLVFSDPRSPRIAYRSFSVRSYPKEFDAFLASGLVGDFNEPNRGYSSPYMITVGWIKPEFDAAKNATDIRAARATQQAATPLAKFMPQLHEKKHDWDIMQSSFTAGKGSVQMYHEIGVFAPEAQIIRAEEAAKSVWKGRSFEIANNTYMGMQGLLSSLPMSLTPAMSSDIKRADRYSTKTVDTVISTAPMIVDWAGVGEPIIPLVGRRGQIGGLDLFANTMGNYNFAIVGASGSGKSFFSQEVVQSYLAAGTKTWVLDNGKSFESLNENLGGQFLDFSPESDICVNPFPMVRDIEEDIEMLSPLVQQMAAGVGGQPLTQYQASTIELAIQAVYAQKGADTTLTDIQLLLKEGNDLMTGVWSQDIAQLATQIAQFCEGGAYAKYFTGKPNISFDSSLTVFEMMDLAKKPALQAVMVLMMLYQITEAMYFMPRNQRKLVLIDEAKEMLKGGSIYAANFIDAAYRRARKFGGSIGTATQGIEDYSASPAAIAALANADWMFLLRQKEESVAAMAKSERFVMNQAMTRTIMGLKKVDNEYAEVYVKSPMGSGLLRLIVDPHTSLLYSSKPDDFTRVRELKTGGLTLDQAIESILRERNQLPEDTFYE
jgi:conjugal transfer ATP-binding protein TraC